MKISRDFACTRPSLRSSPRARWADRDLRSLFTKFISRPEARAVIAEAEGEEGAEAKWTTDRHANYPTTDIPIGPNTVPRTSAWVQATLWPKVQESIGMLWDIAADDLHLDETFVVKVRCARV